MVFILGTGQVLGQPAETDEEEIDFFNLGLISVSPNYILAEDAKFILFTIRNNTTRSISNIFGWVYEFIEDEQGVSSNFRLVNNPNQGGLIIKEKHHTPGTVVQWRFSLIASKQPVDPLKSFTLRISPKGIFFSRIEPQPKLIPPE